MRYLVTIGVPAGDTPLVIQSVGLMAGCLCLLEYQRVLPELANLTSASRDSLTGTLSEWASTVQPTDLVIVYFNGHGDVPNKRHFLALPGTDWNRPTATALATEDLLRALTEGTPLQKLLVILDTCYSGHGAFNAQSIAE